jgi:CRISPR-associated endonuclease/helicase Cas3
VSFPVQGRQLPADHGYVLYSAIIKHVPSLHSAAWLGIELISGIPWGKGVILCQTGVPAYAATSGGQVGARTATGWARLRLTVMQYGWASCLPARLSRVFSVRAYCHHQEVHRTEPFLDAAQRQLTQLGITAALEFPDGHTRSRRIITVHGHKVVGFSLAVHDLSDEDSIKLQSVGLGGRRVMGCGMFNPIVKATWTQEEDMAEAKEA